MFFYFYCLLYPKVATGTKPTINTTNLQEKKKDGGCKQRHRHREKRPLGGGRKKKKDWRKLEGDKSKFNKLCIFASLHTRFPPSRPLSIPGSSRPWRPLNPQDSNQSDVTLWQVMTAHLSARTSSVCCP